MGRIEGYRIVMLRHMGFPVVLAVKNLPANPRDIRDAG